MRAVPIINENDTVATSEIRYGDNDRLAARVATMASADLLILLSDVAGLYDSPPSGERAGQAPARGREGHAGDRGDGRAARPRNCRAAACAPRSRRRGSRLRRGTHMIIADGRVAHPIARVAEGGRCTWFLTPSNPLAARKIWIGGSLELKGAVFVDAGAAAALAGARACCRRASPGSRAPFRAATASPSATSAGRRSGGGSSPSMRCAPSASADAIRATSRHLLGAPGRAEMIHRDDMTLAER